MNYENFRNRIKTGDLIAFSGGSWNSWNDIKINIVRMFTRSEYSHVAIAWVIEDRVLLLEAVSAGVRIFPLSNDLPCYWVERPHRISKEALRWALSKMGQEYSTWQAIKAFFGITDKGKDNKWECAEYVITTYAFDGDYFDCKATPTQVVNMACNKWQAPIYKLEQ